MDFSRTRCTPGACTFVALLAVGMPTAAVAAPKITVAYAEHSYAFVSPCDLTRPLVFVNLRLKNGRDAPTGPVHVTAEDDVHVLEGDATLPQIPASMEIAATLPLRRKASNLGPIAGSHLIAVTVAIEGSEGKHRLTPLNVSVPATFCVTAAATPAPATAPAGPPGAPTPIHPRAPVSAVLTTPPVIRVGANGSKVANVVVLVKPAVPANLHNAGGAADCAAHVGLVASLVCPDMIKSGNLLLIWDWRSDGALADIDGYRTYRVDSGLKQLVYTSNNKKDLTLVDLAPPAGGYTGKCYAVSAYTAKAESDLSPAFCASGSSIAKTIRLPAVQARKGYKFQHNGGYVLDGHKALTETAVVVGYMYDSHKNAFGDNSENALYRGAVAFDVAPLANRRLVSAKLHLQIVDSVGAGNNHSCITNIGTGVEFWWKYAPSLAVWPEVQQADIAPTDTGPEITADVTKLVAPWLIGNPNYGLVLFNRDELIDTFDHRQCRTSYSNPMLEITYY